MMDFAKIDHLNELFAEFEGLITLGFRPDGWELYIARHGERLRLMYEGRAIAECSVQQKLAAAVALPEFVTLYKIHLAKFRNVEPAIEAVRSALREMRT
jgi:hypothetical protein